LRRSPPRGQQAAKVQRVGYLGYDASGSDPTGISGLRQGLRDLGYIENQNIVIEYRFAEGQPDRLPGLISELTNLKVAVLITQGTEVLPPQNERRRQRPSSPCRAIRSA
jgi:putative ABC transport system substrate-binding protein